METAVAAEMGATVCRDAAVAVAAAGGVQRRAGGRERAETEEMVADQMVEKEDGQVDRETLQKVASSGSGRQPVL